MVEFPEALISGALAGLTFCILGICIEYIVKSREPVHIIKRRTNVFALSYIALVFWEFP